MTKGDQVREYLVQHYTCAVIPHGAVTEIASMFGVSREYVRRIAKSLGHQGYRSLAAEDRVIRGRMGRTLCPKCMKPYGVMRYEGDRVGRTHCQDCRWLLLTCEQCGKPKKMLASQYESRTRNPKNRYTGRVFCDRVCFGKWSGLTSGFAAHPENAARGGEWPSIKAEERRQVIVAQLCMEPQTLKDLVERTGLGERSVRANLARLVEAGQAQEERMKTTGRPLAWTR